MSQHDQQPAAPAAEQAATSTDLDQPPSEVWRSIVEPERLARWMGEGSRIEPWSGGELQLADIATGVPRRGRVERIVPQRSIGITWWPDGDPDAATEVSFTLTPIETGTRLTVVETRAHGQRPAALACARGGPSTSPLASTPLDGWVAAGQWRLALLAVSISPVGLRVRAAATLSAAGSCR